MTETQYQYFVIYFDRRDDNRPLVSRKTFINKLEAEHHAKTISKSWNPIVVSTEIKDENK